jgi:rhodanese-related sulfurtransferase
MVFGQVSNKAFNLMINTLISHTVPEISVDSLKKVTDEIILLDAREKNEFEVSHLKNAISVGYDSFLLDSIKNIAKDSPIVVYCSVGYRSEKIGEKLKNAGYTNVRNLIGGIFEWKNKQYPIFNNTGETENIHAYSKTWGIWLSKGNKVYTK